MAGMQVITEVGPARLSVDAWPSSSFPKSVAADEVLVYGTLNGIVVGYVHSAIWSVGVGTLVGVETHPQYLKQGVASMLLEHTVQQFRSRAVTSIECFAVNGACKLYCKVLPMLGYHADEQCVQEACSSDASVHMEFRYEGTQRSITRVDVAGGPLSFHKMVWSGRKMWPDTDTGSAERGAFLNACFDALAERGYQPPSLVRQPRSFPAAAQDQFLYACYLTALVSGAADLSKAREQMHGFARSYLSH